MDNQNLSLSGLKVSVVDDEEDALALTRLTLGLYGADVITSLTAAEGLEQVQMQKLDLIISDISIAKVQEWLRHANIATTRIYDHRTKRPEDSTTFKVSY